VTQPNFLDQCRRDVYIAPVDSHVTEPSECRRLSTQNATILARLQRGPCTNRELAGLSLKYTSRISDLRAAGHVITVKRHPRGLTIYSLERS
jgi:hypothetical protein